MIPLPVDEEYWLPLRYDAETLLCDPVALEMLLPADMPEPEVIVPPVLRTAVMPDEAVFLVAAAPLAVLLLTLLDTDDEEEPLLTDDVPDAEDDELFLDAYVLLTLDPDDVLCP